MKRQMETKRPIFWGDPWPRVRLVVLLAHGQVSLWMLGWGCSSSNPALSFPEQFRCDLQLEHGVLFHKALF